MIVQHGVAPSLAQVLAARGVTVETVDEALKPSLKNLMPDPSLMTDMDRLIARLSKAIVQKEKIALFGDYDVDGACSVALMLRYLHRLGLQPLFHIPDRITEGYGPNIAALEKFKRDGANLVVTLDCGTTSFEAFAAAAELKLDVLVIDHHLADETLPLTNGLVNPNRQDDLSNLGTLCAAGVTFMVLVALTRQLRHEGYFTSEKQMPDLMDFTDLVALATVCDVVPLEGLNRAFVHRGLERIRSRDSIGIRALCDAARVSGPVDTYHLGFMLGPRINAGGRIGDAVLGTRLLVCDDEAEAMKIALQLDTLNQERQVIEQAAVAEAKDIAERILRDKHELAVLVVGSDKWHPGVVGLVASRLKEQFNRPCFAIAFDGDKGTGSGRSLQGVDLGRAVRRAVHEGIVIKGGGHAMAAGVTVSKGDIDRLAAFLDETCATEVDIARANRSLHIDGLLNPAAITTELVSEMMSAGPYGAGCPEPVFALPSMTLLFADVVGSKHLRLTVQGQDGSKLKVMAFRAAGEEFGENLMRLKGKSLHFAVNLSLDSWQGRQSVGLRLVDAAEIS